MHSTGRSLIGAESSETASAIGALKNDAFDVVRARDRTHRCRVASSARPRHSSIDLTMENGFVSLFKNPTFQERIGRAAEAKKKALEQLRSKPPVDEKVAAERQAKSLARQARIDEKATAKKAAQQAAKDAKAAELAAKTAELAAKAAASAPRTEAELKAARDARYAARKARK